MYFYECLLFFSYFIHQPNINRQVHIHHDNVCFPPLHEISTTEPWAVLTHSPRSSYAHDFPFCFWLGFHDTGRWCEDILCICCFLFSFFADPIRLIWLVIERVAHFLMKPMWWGCFTSSWFLFHLKPRLNCDTVPTALAHEQAWAVWCFVRLNVS